MEGNSCINKHISNNNLNQILIKEDENEMIKMEEKYKIQKIKKGNT